MSSERRTWQGAKGLLDVVLDLDPSEREGFLRERCADAPDVLAEVRSLISWVEQSEGFLDTPVVRVSELASPASETPLIGQSLGPWRILSVIGRGGMGIVYRAERADAAFQRVVAIKVVRRGAFAADALTRFQRERETLAALDHPNIARVLDGGSTPGGEPYFVMDYVDGIRVDAYCDQQRLGIDHRLALFRTICAAVQHAHQSLVIHRDIKPDNILVSRDGTPKLLDFGIARLLSDTPGSAENDAHTAATWLMTPDFASPEQVSGSAVTTATDVYSLGVLLHVLLTGRAPYRLTARSRGELRDQLEAVAVSRPSDNVAGDPTDVRDRAAARGLAPDALAQRLTGDLDAIVQCALARDPRARYQTVGQLVDEIERHQTRHPVAARGRAWPYLARTFARRHRVELAIAASLVAIVAVGVAAVLWQAALAADAGRRAERRFDDVRKLAHVFMFDVHDQIVDVPGTTEARVLMVRTGSRYLDELAREASGDLALQRELASAFVRVGDAQGHPASANIGDTAGARASYQRAIAIAGAVLAAAPSDVETERTRAMAHRRLSDVLAWSGDLETALTHCELSRTLFAAAATRAGASEEDKLQTAVADLKLADLLGNPNLPNLRRTAEANAHYGKTLADIRALAAQSPGNERVMRYLGLILERIGTMHEVAAEWPAAARAYQESFELREALAASATPTTDMLRDLAIAYEKLGNVRAALGDTAGAESNYRGALGQFDRLALADPSNANAARSAAISREKLASTLLPLDRHAEAIDLLKTALGTHERLAARDRENAQARCDAANLQETLGNAWTQARPAAPVAACGYWRDALAARRQLGRDGLGCVTADDLRRVTAKMASCR